MCLGYCLTTRPSAQIWTVPAHPLTSRLAGQGEGDRVLAALEGDQAVPVHPPGDRHVEGLGEDRERPEPLELPRRCEREADRAGRAARRGRWAAVSSSPRSRSRCCW